MYYPGGLRLGRSDADERLDLYVCAELVMLTVLSGDLRALNRGKIVEIGYIAQQACTTNIANSWFK
jgi:hypothetical protein